MSKADLKAEFINKGVVVTKKKLDRQNIILMCPNHHRIYFDKIHGPQNQDKLMYIDMANECFIVASAEILQPSMHDCEVVDFRHSLALKKHYVDEKNKKCDPILKGKWLDINGYL
jgi:hypothetical protein